MKARITVVDTLYFQPSGEQPEAVETRYCIECNPSDEPYRRKKTIGNKGVPLEIGHVTEECLMVLINTGNTPLAVSTDGGGSYPISILQKESIRLHLNSARNIQVRTKEDNEGMGSYQVYLFPIN